MDYIYSVTMKKNTLTALLFSLVFSHACLADNEDIIWGVNSSPPFHILSGSYQGDGFCDALIETFQDRLPQLSHKVRQLPSRRITHLMRSNKNLCFPCLIKKTSYNSTFNFTQTTHLYRPHGIITRASLAGDIRSKYGDPVRLAELVEHSNLRFAQPTERRYGQLQPLLEKHLIGSDNFKNISGVNSHVNLLTMLMNNRIDYTIDYQLIMNYYNTTQQERLAQSTEKLVFLPIAEYEGQVIEGAVGCSNNAWGRRAVRELNGVIDLLRRDPDFQRRLDKWLGADRPQLD